ncbi:class I SAM-dependent methyltransferase [Jiangella asiatica]|uniref:Class I SAM-dependent methyltransferase n=1 Tax=Jiangella asiatica TaxID=2530372 RepID=A0A4R5CGY1_9ACTN|nr:class I SAM-dependent methyltransferase [Jiangella asiatica]TDD97543.1 class I SAM-dependent methyltransferase [Jiangella asiatica]
MTEPAFLSAVRESYDTVADSYTELYPPSRLDPIGRAMLTAFAEIVRDAGGGPVADLGCGPGGLTGLLAGMGLDAFGVDLSPRMVELARRDHPDLRFEVGSMTALDLADAGLAAILAFFSTYHTPPEHLPTIYAEFGRTLAPGGRLLLGTYIGDDDHFRPTQAYGGHPVSYESYLLPAERIVALLADAGLVVTARLLVEKPEAKRQYAIFLAQKPARP